MSTVARLSVLYEDLRIEYSALVELAKNQDPENVTERYRLMYFTRRSIATIHEFQGALTYLRGSPEYKNIEGSLSTHNRENIEAANRYLQAQCERVKKWRDAMGGHFQDSVAREACRTIPRGTVGSIEWSRTDEHGVSLRLHYAEHIVTAAAIGRLNGADWQPELREAFNGIYGCYTEVMRATLAIINEFVWNRFGR